MIGNLTTPNHSNQNTQLLLLQARQCSSAILLKATDKDIKMHEYVVAHHDRKKIYYSAAILSSLAGGIIIYVITKINGLTGLAIAGPSGAVLFFLLFLIFDLWIWKFKILYEWGIIKIPNIGGDWMAEISSGASTNKPSTAEDTASKTQEIILANFKVHQNYSRLLIKLDTKNSESISQMASLVMVSPECFKLRYEYLAKYKRDTNSPPLMHYGVTEFTLESANSIFDSKYEASYYTELSRDSHGSIVISRVSKK
ncbi:MULTISPECIES: hypothetical protein [Pseudomonas]|uniref:CD-NTase-associated protein 15 domain-containing protein n=1 Tax=Pseudomonas aphyarum TaxID=2942629 RepID=A0ABT5PKR8_9PSED|nr:hypothetical protein [Pseudomonas aphyarum]MDD0968503.1 hypothetical protein [Pseudomonas aphyarum]MDD1124403.1 hypothetical protein [Pseudomonas aphyarum]